MYRVDTSEHATGVVSNRQTGCCAKLAGRRTARRTLTAMSPWRVSPSLDARAMVDYTLARRATLTALAAGRRSPVEVCDAQTYLVRAARYHGERARGTGPRCAREAPAPGSFTLRVFFPRVANRGAPGPR